MGFNLKGLDEWSREALACHEVLRRLGFSTSQIGAGFDKNGAAFVTLHHEAQQYNIMLGKPIDVSSSQFMGRWRESVRSVASSDINEVDFQEMLLRSEIWRNMKYLTQDLLKRGFIK